MILPRSDGPFNILCHGPIATRWREIVDQAAPSSPLPSVKRTFISTEVLPLLRQWCDTATLVITTDEELDTLVREAYDVAEFWRWMLRDDAAPLLFKLSAAFATSCKNLAMYIRAFVSEHGKRSYPARMALLMMVQRAKEELATAQGWK